MARCHAAMSWHARTPNWMFCESKHWLPSAILGAPAERVRAGRWLTGPTTVGTVLALVFVIPAVMLCDQARRRAWRH